MTTHYRWETALDQRRTRDPGIDASERREDAQTAREAFVLGYHLAQMRKARGLTQQMVAQSMGVSQVRVSRMENGELGRMQMESISAYIAALGGHLELTAKFAEEDEGEHVDVVAISRAIVHAATRLWSASDRHSLLQRIRLEDSLLSRQITVQLESLMLSAEGRMRPLLSAKWADVDAKKTALHHALMALHTRELTGEDILSAIDDPAKLAQLARDALADPNAQLEPSGARFYSLVVTASSVLVAEIASALSRLAAATPAPNYAQFVKLGQEIEDNLPWLPLDTLGVPEGYPASEDYTWQYLHAFGIQFNWQEPFEADRRLANCSHAAWDAVCGSVEVKVGDERITTPVESLLRHPRIIVFGSAGSGKTALLVQLAMLASRRGSPREAALSGTIPFFISLRDYSDRNLPSPEKLLNDNAAALASAPPKEWVRWQLRAGRAMVLLDGADEVMKAHRSAIKVWIRDLLRRHPDNQVVITSRHSAVDPRWLQEEGFVYASVEPLNKAELWNLIHFRHAIAAKADVTLANRIQAYETALRTQLEAVPGLQELATTPLLAAVMSRANMERGELPGRLTDLYKASTEALLNRRYSTVSAVAGGRSTQLLQYLAWVLLVRGRAQIERNIAEDLVALRLPSVFPWQPTAAPVDILDALIGETGVLDESSRGTIHFRHRAIQDYLAAREAADIAAVDLLAAKAHVARWYEVIVLAAEQLNQPGRIDLLKLLLKRIAKQDERSSRIKLVVIALLESLSTIPAEVAEEVNQYVEELVPPHNLRTALSLASVGEPLLDKMPDTLAGATTESAKATIKAVQLISGRRAVELLRRYSQDPRPPVRIAAVDALKPLSAEDLENSCLS
ncbi:hypothetical protein Sru01_40890 [Sphaerisporangium rufum]|uniref:NACHT domain-containing protein n=1 Tax=Sphaerisporangium rufum TaxID=1381558 RepID=A0A919V1X6_9ACTN|nr:NACHT domain-containing protein [Sphaerisporangium rufum]GII79107.1 hypothetical protein Sru01_40890 [Sphaerisporangium rufum]